VGVDLDRVWVACEGRLVADHPRCWARHQTISDPAHLAAAARLRAEQATVTPRDQGEVQPRRLADYDAAFGLNDGQGGLMPANSATRNLTAELAFLTRALKAPSLREAAGRLAERARAEGWTHEEFLAACRQREVAAREAHGGEGRIRHARFPARKSLEEFDYDHARALQREQIAHLGTLDFVTGRGTWCS
jgi:IstB-like ATP binding protein